MGLRNVIIGNVALLSYHLHLLCVIGFLGLRTMVIDDLM